MSQTHWSKMQERGSYWGMQFLLAVYKLFGRKVLWVFLVHIFNSLFQPRQWYEALEVTSKAPCL